MAPGTVQNAVAPFRKRARTDADIETVDHILSWNDLCSNSLHAECQDDYFGSLTVYKLGPNNFTFRFGNFADDIVTEEKSEPLEEFPDKCDRSIRIELLEDSTRLVFEMTAKNTGDCESLIEELDHDPRCFESTDIVSKISGEFIFAGERDEERRPILKGTVKYVKDMTYADIEGMEYRSFECSIETHTFDDGEWDVVLRGPAASEDEGSGSEADE